MIKAYTQIAFVQPQIKIDDAFGYWLSGFVDGEGCFGIIKNRHNRALCTFQLCMRADDADIIESIHNRLHIGYVYYQDRNDLRKRGISAGTAVNWQVKRIDDLYNVLVPIFTRYPLRTRKAKEFAIWKEAVLISAKEKGIRAISTENKLQQLKKQLRELKTNGSNLKRR